MNVEKEIDSQWRIPDTLWALMVPLLPPEPAKPKGGRPRIEPRQAMDGIFYHLRTGCQWKAIPRSLVAGSTAHDYFQLWQEAGLFHLLWHETLKIYDDQVGIEWLWQALDGVMTKAPLGGETTGRNPTDRGKQGVKRSILTDGRGVPLAAAVEGANRHDMKLVGATLYQLAIARPEPTTEQPRTWLWTRLMILTWCVDYWNNGATPLTFALEARKNNKNKVCQATAPAAGWSNGAIPG